MACIADEAATGLELALGHDDTLESLAGIVDGLVGDGGRLGDELGELPSGPILFSFDDTRDGCPPSHAAELPFWEESFELDRDAEVTIHAKLSSDSVGRSDLRLHRSNDVDDLGIVDQRIFYTSEAADAQWSTGSIDYTDKLAAGTWTVGLSSSMADDWGCGADWGRMTVLVH